MKKIKINIDGATLQFYEIELDGVKYYEFNATKSVCPEPMLNAMIGLKFISQNAKKSKLIMINSHEPKGLYNKIEGKFNWSVEDMMDGKFKIVFESIEGKSKTTDFTKIECEG